jgi:DNA-binding NarL/FixJ family response regulator
MIRLLIADADPAVRDGLYGVLDGAPSMMVVGVAADADETLRLTYRLRPDLVLLDLRIGDAEAVAAIRHLAASAPSVRVLALAVYDTDPDLLAAIEAGAVGYILKGTPRDTLVEIVRAASRGKPVPGPSPEMKPTDWVRGPRRPVGDGLSRRELEVLALVAKGSSNEEAAAALFVSEATVGRYLESVYTKLGVTDRTEAVTEALRRVILELDSPSGR